jgi:hypothetical protein
VDQQGGKREMKCQRMALFIGAVMAFFPWQVAMGQSADSDVNAYIARAPIAGLPPGTYSQWTETQRKTVVARIGGFCQYLCVDAYSNMSFPNAAAAERAKAEVKVCLGACIANHLPADHPQLEELKQQLRADYDKGRQLGSPMRWPLPK